MAFQSTSCPMTNKTFGLILAFCFLTSGACFADLFSPQMGTWKLNAAKSKLSREMGRNDMVDYEMSFMKTKVTISGVDKNGHALHSEWKGNFDGHDYPVTGDPASDARSYRKVNDNTMEFTVKQGGKVMATGKIVVAPDGNSRTVTSWSTNSKGKRVTTIAVYDKVNLRDKVMGH